MPVRAGVSSSYFPNHCELQMTCYPPFTPVPGCTRDELQVKTCLSAQLHPHARRRYRELEGEATALDRHMILPGYL